VALGRVGILLVHTPKGRPNPKVNRAGRWPPYPPVGCPPDSQLWLRYSDPYEDPFGFDQRLPKSPPTAVKGDEYEQWQLDRKPGDRRIRDPIKYWIEKQDRYPRLSRMALDFLTIQAMSTKCEKVFSAAGKMLMAERNKLEVEAIAMCQVLRSWYLAGVIKDSNTGLEPLQVSKGGGNDENSDDERNVGGAEQQSGAKQVVTSAARNTGSQHQGVG
jgi:hypothetical protein